MRLPTGIQFTGCDTITRYEVGGGKNELTTNAPLTGTPLVIPIQGETAVTAASMTTNGVFTHVLTVVVRIVGTLVDVCNTK